MISEGNFNNLKIPSSPSLTPESLSKDYITAVYNQELKVMTAGCKYLALEYFSFPLIRKIARDLFKKYCCITTEPTEEGSKELNPLSVGYRVKRISRKTFVSFNEDLFLEMLEYENKNLIKINIEYTNDYFLDMTEKLNFAINGENKINENLVEQNSWRIMREETLRILVAEYCIPFFIKEIRDELKEKAEIFVIKKCANEFENILITGPYKKCKNVDINRDKINSNENDFDKEDLFNVEEFAKVISFVYDNSKNRIYGASLDESGENLLNVEFDKLLINPLHLNSKEDKDDKAIEELKLKEFIFNFKPDLIVIGANDLKCKIFREQLMSIGEEMKKGVY